MDVEREEATGWDETDFRPYDSQIGRFFQVDQLAEWDFDWTPYRYAYNNPIFYNDPTGLWEQTNNGWRTSDIGEIADFLQALKGAESNIEIIDAEDGNSNGELFRVVGDGRVASIFFGPQRREDSFTPTVKIVSQKNEAQKQRLLEGVPWLGRGFEGVRYTREGDYLGAGLAFWDVVTARRQLMNLGKKSATTVLRAKAPPTRYKPFTSWNYRHNLKVLTQSLGEGMDAHHIFPKASKFQKHWKRVGLNVHDPNNMAWWPSKPHRQNAQSYNKEWSAFFRRNPNAMLNDIKSFGRAIMNKYGF